MTLIYSKESEKRKLDSSESLLYISDGGNILTEATLRGIRQFEQNLEHSAVYQRWGWRDHSSPTIATRGAAPGQPPVTDETLPPVPVASLLQYGNKSEKEVGNKRL